MSAETKPRYTLEEYLEFDAKSAERLVYWQGEIFSMSGASEEHAEIEGNLMAFLKHLVFEKTQTIFLSPQWSDRIEVYRYDLYH